MVPKWELKEGNEGKRTRQEGGKVETREGENEGGREGGKVEAKKRVGGVSRPGKWKREKASVRLTPVRSRGTQYRMSGSVASFPAFFSMFAATCFIHLLAAESLAL